MLTTMLTLTQAVAAEATEAGAPAQDASEPSLELLDFLAEFGDDEADGDWPEASDEAALNRPSAAQRAADTRAVQTDRNKRGKQ